MRRSDSIFEKKLMLPKVSGFFIDRERLYDIFDDREQSVFIISSKAGTGKTYAVAQYCREKEAEVLWYALDKSDNVEESFLGHLMCGMSRIDQEVEEKVGHLLDSPVKLTKDVIKFFIHTLLEMAEHKKKENRKLYIVLDGFEHIVNRNILNMVKMLLEYSLGQMKVFILTSFGMKGCFSKYMAEGNYKKITEKELCFSLEEIRKLAERNFEKRQIKKEYIQKIEGLTGGWPIAVECLIQFMVEREEKLSKVMEMSKENLLMDTILYDYIQYEIYERFSQDEQEFFVKTVILQELDAALCNSCLNREDSGKMLHAFLNKHLLEVLWKDGKQYIQYFELFQLFLLEQGEKRTQREIQKRAGAFYVHKQQYDKAVWYAKNDVKWICSLFEQYGKKLLQENRLDLVKQCINILNESGHEFSIVELEIVAEYFYQIGNNEQMEHYLNCADSMFGKENKYGMYRSLYRALFHYSENPEKYEKQINNVLFFLEENKIPYPYLLEKEQKILDKVIKEKNKDLQESEEKKIKVSAFGTFRAVILEDGKELSWRTKKGCELFAYLLDRGGEAVERKTLLSELWKSEIPNNAVAMLHNMFYNMRKELSYYNLEHIIQYRNKKYSMDISLIQSDLNEMQTVSHYVETKNVEKLKEYKQLFLIYQGRYLEDMDNEWIQGKQEYYEKVFEKGCCILAVECMEQAEYDEALTYLKNALSVSVYSEKIVSMMLQCYYKIGDLKGVKRQYEEFCILLKNELNLTPGENLQKSYQECMMR